MNRTIEGPRNRRRIHVPMVGRSIEEEHRAATPLELFFDLVFVVAVDQLARRLQHGVTGHETLVYLALYGPIWWAWVGFVLYTDWFGTDDLGDRLVNAFLKCEVSQDGMVRGRRNAMLDDSDVHWHRQIKACVGGVTAAVTGDPTREDVLLKIWNRSGAAGVVGVQVGEHYPAHVVGREAEALDALRLAVVAAFAERNERTIEELAFITFMRLAMMGDGHRRDPPPRLAPLT